MTRTPNISTSLCETKLSNPLILAAGPYGRDSKTLSRAVKAGFGAVTTKTIRLVAARNVSPNLAKAGRDSLVNAEKWSDIPFRKWVEQEIPYVKSLGVPVIASIGFTAKETRKIAPSIQDAGADFIETVTYDALEILPMVKAVKSVVEVPVIVKLSGNWQTFTKIAVKAEKLGADAISAIDSVGPTLAIDVETGKPSLGSINGEGWLSGSSIQSLAVRCVADAARNVNIPVIGIGGVSNGVDVVEMVMAGASCVGLCTAPILHGLQVVDRIKMELVEFMIRKGYKCLDEMQGLALMRSTIRGKEGNEKLYPSIDVEKCSLCELCVNTCPYQALTTTEERIFHEKNKCLSCGLCYSICPHRAITLVWR